MLGSQHLFIVYTYGKRDKNLQKKKWNLVVIYTLDIRGESTHIFCMGLNRYNQ